MKFTSMYCHEHGNPVARLAARPRAPANQPWVSRTNAYTHLCAAARRSHRINMTRLCTASLHGTFCTRCTRRPRSIDWISMSATVLGTACPVLLNEIQSRQSRLRLAPFFPARCSLVLGCATPGAYLTCATGFHRCTLPCINMSQGPKTHTKLVNRGSQSLIRRMRRCPSRGGASPGKFQKMKQNPAF